MLGKKGTGGIKKTGREENHRLALLLRAIPYALRSLLRRARVPIKDPKLKCPCPNLQSPITNLLSFPFPALNLRKIVLVLGARAGARPSTRRSADLGGHKEEKLRITVPIAPRCFSVSPSDSPKEPRKKNPHSGLGKKGEASAPSDHMHQPVPRVN